MNKLGKSIALVLIFTLCVLPLSGCQTGNKVNVENNASNSTEPSTDQNVSKSSSNNGMFTYNIGVVQKSIDPSLATTVDEANIDANLFEGLCDLEMDGTVTPGVAESWDISGDGMHYTFHIRDNAKWSDGEPIKAQDFEYSWKRSIDPKTASPYAYQLYPIKNAEAANTAQCPIDDVGVKALDDKTLQVDLEYPCPYFLSLMPFPQYFPERQDIVEADPDGWTHSPDTLVSNGPYYLTEYVPKDHYILTANPNYWNASEVTLPEFRIDMVTDENTSYAAFMAGQYDVVDKVPSSEVQKGVQDGYVQVSPSYGTFFLVYNLDEESCNQIDPAAATVLQDVNVRNALNLAIDRTALTSITDGGETPAYSLIPPGSYGPDGSDFNGKQYFPPEGDVDKAKELLAEAGYPDGKGFPTLEVTYNTDNKSFAKVCQAIQMMWETNLGIKTELKPVENQVLTDQRANGEFEIARNGWYGDYADPMTFLDLFVTDSGQNSSSFSNEQYDELISEAKTTTDETARWDLMHQSEDILMQEMPAIPLYYYTNVKGIQPYVKGLEVSSLGYMYFDKVTTD